MAQLKYKEYSKQPCSILVKATLDILMEGVYEIRIPKHVRKGTSSGYWNDASACSIAVDRLNGDAPGIYVTLNPVNPALLARCSNRMESFATVTTTDSEIVKRRWLPLDFDPKRPAGVSSTDAEHEAALDRASDVKKWLKKMGWPDPIEADSGNGAHLLYRIDMPNDQASSRLIAETIRAIAAIWSDELVNVDETVHNAARIWKIYGTISGKGDNTPERPWRVSKLLRVPEIVGIVSADQLEALAAPSRSEREDAINSHGGRIQDLASYVEDLGVKVQSGPLPLFGRGQKWVLETCPFNPDHKKPIIGLVEGKPIFRCLHQSCSSHGWHAFREKIDPGYSSPEHFANKMLDGDPSDPKWIEPLAALGLRAYGLVRDRLKIHKVKGLRAIDKAVELERQRNIEAAAADSGVPGNVYGLSMQIRQLQSEGVLPAYWDNVLDGCRYVGPVEDKKLFRTEEHANRVMIEFHKRGLKWVSIPKVIEAIDYIMQDGGQRNPMRESLESLQWDGIERLSNWLPMYLGTEDNDYTRAVGRKWLISAVARIMRPGCQVDYMLILEGHQGIGKSQALRIIGGDYYSEYGGDFASNIDYARFVSTLIGKSIVEMSELSSFKRNGMESLKHVLTTTVDRARLAYRRDAQDFPRTCVFAGSTNANGAKYIHDPTGARRFWPVQCFNIRSDRLEAVRDQLWAEALHAFKNGEDWWQVPTLLTQREQETRQLGMEDDPWYDIIITAMGSADNWNNGIFRVHQSFPNPTVRIDSDMAMFLAHIFSIDPQHQSAQTANRVSALLIHMGFRSGVIGNSGNKRRRRVLDLSLAPDYVLDVVKPFIDKAASIDLQIQQAPDTTHTPPGSLQ